MESHAAEHQPKKARFDARNPSTLAADPTDDDDDDAQAEDAILELDEIGKSGAQQKRNAVRLEGYESDSSNENFDARAEAKAEVEKRSKTKAKSKDEEDNDMFADLDEEFADGDDDEEIAVEGKKRKREVRFLAQDDIEGQVANSKSGGHVSADFTMSSNKNNRTADVESSSDESGDDEERAKVGDEVDEELGAGGKKSHAPKLDAFNMAQEQEDGKFDDSGNFVRKATDPFAVHDSWLEGSSKADVKRAREAHEKREMDRRRRDIADDAISTTDILSRLITNMHMGETILEALQRMGTKKDKRKTKLAKNRRKDEIEMEVDTGEDAAEQKRKETVENITSAADQLLTRGQTDIYEAEREVLMRQYKRESGEDWVDTGTDAGTTNVHAKQWEYHWSDARDGGEVHGPYDGPTMISWDGAGYFGEGVEFRETGSTEWNKSIDFI